MIELRLVEWIQRHAPNYGRGVITGIGDDCAVFRPRGSSEDLLFTTDQFLEGVHFRPGDRAETIGYRALARGLSDIAAMGGEARFCLISLSVPRRLSGAWTQRFFRGVQSIARRWKITLAGGDLASGKVPGCDVVVCGSTERRAAILRTGAKPGDSIYVSGCLGRPASKGYPAQMFEPRLALGRRLRGLATSCIDISDGLSLDLQRLCTASGRGARLDFIPVAHGATIEEALHGGDEYELLFTAPAEAVVPVGVQRIGFVTADPAGCIYYGGSRLEPGGFQHFRATPR